MPPIPHNDTLLAALAERTKFTASILDERQRAVVEKRWKEICWEFNLSDEDDFLTGDEGLR
jgi:hypothetical protein